MSNIYKPKTKTPETKVGDANEKLNALPADKPHLFWPYMQITLAMILIGVNVPASKVVLGEVPPLIFFLLRSVVASALLFPFALRKNGLRPGLTPKGWAVLFTLSLTGVVLFSMLVLYGMRYTSALSAGIITSSLPAVVAVLSFVFLREHISLRRLLSITLAIVGLVILNIQAVGPSNTSSLIGNFLVILAVCAEAIYTIIAKRFTLRIAPLKVAIWVNWIALVLILPFSFQAALSFDYKAVSLHIWVLLFWITLSSSLLSFFLWYRALAKVDASLAGLFTALIPLSSTLVAILILGEVSTTGHLISIACILTAIFISTYFGQQRKR